MNNESKNRTEIFKESSIQWRQTLTIGASIEDRIITCGTADSADVLSTFGIHWAKPAGGGYNGYNDLCLQKNNHHSYYQRLDKKSCNNVKYKRDILVTSKVAYSIRWPKSRAMRSSFSLFSEQCISSRPKC